MGFEVGFRKGLEIRVDKGGSEGGSWCGLRILVSPLE